MSAELENIWKRMQAELARSVDEPTYRIWLEPLRLREVTPERLVVEAPSQACGWIETRFGGLLRAAGRAAMGMDAVVQLTSAAAPVSPPLRGTRLGSGEEDEPWQARHGHRPDHPRRRSSDHPPPASAGGSGAPVPAADADPLENHKLTFKQFVIGDGNRLAHAAALTVAELPASAYNPLFICGPAGVGKTHLLISIARLLHSHSPGLTVRCTTGEAFTNEFLRALAEGNTDGFKARFRRIDVLLVDDVQFFERKVKTEEEFFHTFNALHDAGLQIVLTSDRPPYDLGALEARLRERFEAGLVADIRPPDLNTRVAILRKRAHDDGLVELNDERALTVIAERIETNVRALEGALIRVIAFSSLAGRPLTGELAEEVLDNLYPRASAPGRAATRSIAEIETAVSEHFGVSREELISGARTARVVWPRQVAMYLARELTGESLPSIGRYFGGRDHTTVIHACRRASSRMLDDERARQAVEDVSLRLDHASRQARPSPLDRSA